MIIKLGNLVLARGDSLNESPTSFKINGQKLVQIEHTLRAQHALVYDRGNVHTAITFEVKRTHKSAPKANAFIISHTVEVTLASGDLEITLEPTKKIYILESATLRNTRSRVDGIHSYHEYEVIGSKLAG